MAENEKIKLLNWDLRFDGSGLKKKKKKLQTNKTIDDWQVI